MARRYRNCVRHSLSSRRCRCPLSTKIRTAIRVWIGEEAKEKNAKASQDDIRFVFNTHWHGDHTGGNENFGESGVLIITHNHVRDRLRTEQFLTLGNRHIPASPKIAWPVVTFDEGVIHARNTQRAMEYDPAPPYAAEV